MNGWKTYSAAIALVVFAITGYFTGQLEGPRAFELLAGAVGLTGLRHAIAKGQVPATEDTITP